MKKVFRILLWTIIGLLFVSTFVYLYLNSQDKKDSYQTVKPSIATIERSTVLTGKIEPRDEIDIKPQISGIITEIEVEAASRSFPRPRSCRRHRAASTSPRSNCATPR